MALGAAGAASSIRRRESARAVFQRLHAVPVQLFPSFTGGAVDGEGVAVCDIDDAGSLRTTASCGDAVKTELGANSICLLTSSSGTSAHRSSLVLRSPLALQRYAYEVAGAHALRGGRVMFMCGPASASFSLPRFTLQVERLWVMESFRQASPQAPQRSACAGSSSSNDVPSSASSNVLPPPPLSAAAQLQARQQAVMEAVARVEVLTCASMADVYAVCRAYTLPPPSYEVNSKSSSSATGARESPVPVPHVETHQLPITEASNSAEKLQRVPDVIPLCVVDGLTGPTSITTLQERATGQAFPIPHYLLCLLQRRLQCALLIVETPTSTVNMADEARNLNTQQQQQRCTEGDVAAGTRTDPRASLPSEELVLADSDFVRRLRVPHEHLLPQQPSSLPASRGAAGMRECGAQRRTLRGRAPRLEEGERGSGEAEQWPSPPAPPFSLHNVHLCVVYVEVDAVAHDVALSNAALTRSGTGVVSRSSSALLSSYTLSLRYRLHLMKTWLSDGAGSARSSSRRSSFRADGAEEEGGRNSFGARRSGSGCWGSEARPGWSSRRNSAAYAPSYTGMWVQSREWCAL